MVRHFLGKNPLISSLILTPLRKSVKCKKINRKASHAERNLRLGGSTEVLKESGTSIHTSFNELSKREDFEDITIAVIDYKAEVEERVDNMRTKIAETLNVNANRPDHCLTSTPDRRIRGTHALSPITAQAPEKRPETTGDKDGQDNAAEIAASERQTDTKTPRNLGQVRASSNQVNESRLNLRAVSEPVEAKPVLLDTRAPNQAAVARNTPAPLLHPDPEIANLMSLHQSTDRCAE